MKDTIIIWCGKMGFLNTCFIWLSIAVLVFQGQSDPALWGGLMLEGRKPKSVHVVNSALPVHLKSLSKTFLASKDEYGPFLPEKVSQDPRLVTGRGKKYHPKQK